MDDLLLRYRVEADGANQERDHPEANLEAAEDDAVDNPCSQTHAHAGHSKTGRQLGPTTVLMRRRFYHLFSWNVLPAPEGAMPRIADAGPRGVPAAATAPLSVLTSGRPSRLAFGQFAGQGLSETIQLVQEGFGQLRRKSLSYRVLWAVGGARPQGDPAQLADTGIPELLRHRRQKFRPPLGAARDGALEQLVGRSRGSQCGFIHRRTLMPRRFWSPLHVRPGTSVSRVDLAHGFPTPSAAVVFAPILRW